MTAPITPVLLRPPTTVAELASQAAAAQGVSRNTWIVGVLQAALEAEGYAVQDQPHPADLPLPGV